MTGESRSSPAPEARASCCSVSIRPCIFLRESVGRVFSSRWAQAPRISESQRIFGRAHVHLDLEKSPTWSPADRVVCELDS